MAEERLKAAMQHNNNSASTGNRQRRPAGVPAQAKVMSGISRIPSARVKQPPSAMSGGASRVGQGGGVRKLTGRIVMKKVAEKLPLRYREEVMLQKAHTHGCRRMFWIHIVNNS